jgi:peptide deformylase
VSDELKIILYPDPRLRKMSKTVKVFNADLASLAAKMLEMMREAKGVGLAAPQVGINIRLFVVNATGKPEDDRIIVNPALSEAEGEDTAEEGCLSIPDVKVDILRAKALKLEAQDVNGKPIVEVQSGYVARIWQHEFDHLNGTLLTDRMGPLARITHRRKLKELEDQWASDHPEEKEKKKSK